MSEPQALSEQVQIEAVALELGWVLNRVRASSRFTRDDHMVVAWWSDNGVATSASFYASDELLAIREYYHGTSGTVGDWLRMMLSAIAVGRATA